MGSSYRGQAVNPDLAAPSAAFEGNEVRIDRGTSPCSGEMDGIPDLVLRFPVLGDMQSSEPRRISQTV